MIKRISVFVLFMFMAFFIVEAKAAEVVYDHGGYCNIPPTAEEAGKSVVYSSLNEDYFGIGVNASLGYELLDEFTLDEDTYVQYVEFYIYNNNSGSTSMVTEGFFSIYDKIPTDQTAVKLYGDLSSSLVTSDFTNCYRVLEGSLTDVSRPIMSVRLEVDETIPSGTYWIGYSVNSRMGYSGPWGVVATTSEGVMTGKLLHNASGQYSEFSENNGIRLRLPFKFLVETPRHPDVSAPDAFTITHLSVQLVEHVGYEYKLGDGDWQDSGLFEELNPNTSYSFVQRIKASEGFLASNTSEPLVVSTLKTPQEVPVAPWANRTTATSIQLSEFDGMEYRIVNGEWQNGGLFESLQPNTSYTFEQRYKETDVLAASPLSAQASFITTKLSAILPVAPVLDEVSDSSVRLVSVSGYQYRHQDGEWQDSELFEGLDPKTTYTFVQRIKETNTTYASETSAGLDVTTLRSINEKPAKPVVDEIGVRNFTLIQDDEIEYSLDGQVWVDLPEFDGLVAGSSYTVYYRFKDTLTQGEPIVVLTGESLIPDTSDVDMSSLGSLLFVLGLFLLMISSHPKLKRI